MSTVSDDRLISAGTPADSASIQFLETVAVVSGALVVGSLLLPVWSAALGAAVAAALTGYGAHHRRRKRLLLNEKEAREALVARYRFPNTRTATIEGLDAPADVKTAALSLVGQHRMSQADIAVQLSVRVGETRARQYLPLILQQADRSLEADAPSG